MSYLIYGKIAKPIKLYSSKERAYVINEPQDRFKALTYEGYRTSRLENAGEYAEYSDAEEVVEKVKKRLEDTGQQDAIVFEIRKSK